MVVLRKVCCFIISLKIFTFFFVIFFVLHCTFKCSRFSHTIVTEGLTDRHILITPANTYMDYSIKAHACLLQVSHNYLNCCYNITSKRKLQGLVNLWLTSKFPSTHRIIFMLTLFIQFAVLAFVGNNEFGTLKFGSYLMGTP